MCAIKINEIEAKMTEAQRQDLVRWALRECVTWADSAGLGGLLVRILFYVLFFDFGFSKLFLRLL